MIYNVYHIKFSSYFTGLITVLKLMLLCGEVLCDEFFLRSLWFQLEHELGVKHSVDPSSGTCNQLVWTPLKFQVYENIMENGNFCSFME